MQQFEAVLSALLGAWEEVKAAEEARAQLEAQLYKTKTQSTTILTEEARSLNYPCCLKNRACVPKGVKGFKAVHVIR